MAAPRHHVRVPACSAIRTGTKPALMTQPSPICHRHGVDGSVDGFALEPASEHSPVVSVVHLLCCDAGWGAPETAVGCGWRPRWCGSHALDVCRVDPAPVDGGAGPADPLRLFATGTGPHTSLDSSASLVHLPSLKSLSSENDAGFFSRLTFGWITPLLQLGNQRELQMPDLWYRSPEQRGVSSLP
jgi:hypothetical protein